nr:hypothetical protein P410_08 [uncultured Alphaproteobacteria bacterium]
MRYTLAAAAALLLLAGSGPARAAFITREFLLRSCAGQSATDRADCTGYIIGVADTLLSPQDGPATVCLPAGLAMGRLRSQVVQYLRGHEGAAAAPLVRAALQSAYPCGR